MVRRALGRTFSGTPVATALPGARVALCSGTELLWPETSRLAAVDGADILLVLDDGDVPAPQGFPGSALALGGVSAPPNPWHYWIPRVRAITDDLCVAYASAQRPCGFFQAESGAGDAGDLGAAGVLDTRAGAEGDPQVRRKPFLQRRRPEHYRALWRAGTARDGQGAGGRPVGEG